MKTYLLLAALVLATPAAIAQAPASEPAPLAAPAKANNRHLKLCAMLGLKVGLTYEFLLTGNEEIHFWEVRSLGANGWILARDSRSPATWVNLSQIIAITPIITKESPLRPKKPNRAN